MLPISKKKLTDWRTLRHTKFDGIAADDYPEDLLELHFPGYTPAQRVELLRLRDFSYEDGITASEFTRRNAKVWEFADEVKREYDRKYIAEYVRSTAEEKKTLKAPGPSLLMDIVHASD